MSTNGHVYLVTNPIEFFLPIIQGGSAPSSGYIPFVTTWVQVTYFTSLFEGFPPVPITSAGPVPTAPDGSFSLPDPNPAIVTAFGGESSISVFVRVSVDPLLLIPLYRSDLVSLQNAEMDDIRIWVYPDRLPTSDGITAGAISGLVGNAGLPGNTNITAASNGLSFSGSSGQVNLQFGVALTPDVSDNLNDFLDIALASYDIQIGWPASWFESTADILNKIKNGLQGIGPMLNAAILSKIETILEAPLSAGGEGLQSGQATYFLTQQVSVTFLSVSYPNAHSWPLSNRSDSTVVLLANPAIGYPRDPY
jgi:hypothetical protein